jgi:hypothetical protein
MAISLLDNIAIKKKSPNVERDLFATIADMAAYNENYLPDVFECNVVEDGNRYRYNRTNIVDPVFGKWRIVESGAGAELIDYYKKTETDELLDKKVSIEEGKGLSSNDYTTVEKEKLASLENYDDSEVREHIINSEQAIADIQTSLGAEILATTAQTVKGAVNEVKTNAEAAATALDARVKTNEDAIAIINGDSTVTGSIKKSASTTLRDAKSYTDQKIAEMASEQAIVCDEKPSYMDGITTYIKDGVPETIDEENIWFYYEADGQLMQTIWINGEEITIVSAGGVNFDDFVSKSKDIVATYEGDETDTDKIPNFAAMQALEALLKTDIDTRVKTVDIYDALDSASAAVPLSANQGRVLNEKVDSKLDKTFVGDEIANKHLVTDTMGNIVLTDYDDALDATSANAVQNKVIKTELEKKFDKTQDIANAGKVLTVGEDGVVTFSDSTALGSTAEKVFYENDVYFTDVTNLKQAVDKILAKVYYEEPEITNFTMTPSTDIYEIGTVIPADTIEFSWAVNKEIKSQALTDCTVAADDRYAIYGAELSNTKTFVLTVSDGEKAATASKKISFLNKGYWGSATVPDEYNSEFVLGLSGSKFVTGKAGTYSMSIVADEYGFLALPTSFGTVSSVWIGGFEVTVETAATISFTNASGKTSSYNIYKTGRSGLGSITMEIK